MGVLSCFTSKFGQFSPGVFLVVWSNSVSGFSIEQGKTQSTKMLKIKLARMVDRISLRIAQVLIIPWTWGIAVTFGNRFFCSGDFEWWPFPCWYPWYVSHQGCDGCMKSCWITLIGPFWFSSRSRQKMSGLLTSDGQKKTAGNHIETMFFLQVFCFTSNSVGLHMSQPSTLVVSSTGSPQNTSENAQLWGMIEALEMALQAADCLVNGCKKYNPTNTGWWFGTFFIFTNSWDDDPVWLTFFRGVETTKPGSHPTGRKVTNHV